MLAQLASLTVGSAAHPRDRPALQDVQHPALGLCDRLGRRVDRPFDLAVAPVSTLGSPSVQRFGATLSAASSTAGTGPDVTAPSAPSVSVVGVTASSASVWWLPSIDDVGVAAYRLYVGGTLFDGHGTSPETIGNLPCGVPVTIAVDAVDAAGNASAQSTVTATPGPCGGGDAARLLHRRRRVTRRRRRRPTGVSRLRGQPTGVTLSWTASTDDVGVTGYRLFRDGSQVGTSAHDQLRLLRPDLRDDLHARRRRSRCRRQRLRHRDGERRDRSVSAPAAAGHDTAFDADRPLGLRCQPDRR